MAYFEFKIPFDADRVDDTFIPFLVVGVIPFQVIAHRAYLAGHIGCIRCGAGFEATHIVGMGRGGGEGDEKHVQEFHVCKDVSVRASALIESGERFGGRSNILRLLLLYVE